jgi:molybdenum cofactor biosynthesis enzyme MoaA
MAMNYVPTDEELAHKQLRRDARLADTHAAFQKPNQVLGRRSTIGCVALEITQRCNLDCTLCYLSEYSEAVPDPPMADLKRRLDIIKDKFGVHTNVQITGGDPTLRPRAELVEIIAYAAKIGLYPALFTNGIRASRELLRELADVGLVDLALHVDLTQERKGYRTEVELNRLREKYLERAQGLGLALIFNTTIFAGNVDEIPDLVRFFVKHAGALGMASFQLQADTGRGSLHKRDLSISQQRIRSLIEQGCEGVLLSWESVLFGHPKCHNIAYTIVSGGKVIDLFDDERVLSRWLRDFGKVQLNRTQIIRSSLAVLRHMLIEKPDWLRYGGAWAGRKLLAAVPPAFAALLATGRKPQLGKLSFFVQNFMDADAIDFERTHHCSFHVATRDGTMSMCEHNAQRDEHIIPPNLVRGRDIKPKRPPIASVLRPDEEEV